NTCFVKCAECGLVYQNPQPEQSELVERYDGEYFDYEIENEDSFYNLMKLGLNDIGFFEIENAIINKCLTSGDKPSFLDIGCATGRLIYEMSKRGWNVKGVEVCKASAEYGIKERSLDIRIMPFEDCCFQDKSFDVVHCSHLIEHLTSPDSFVEEASRVLKPGGLFIITTPDIGGFQSKLFGSEWRSAIEDHMFLFSYKDLKTLCEKKGFSIQKKVSWGGLAVGTVPAPVKKIADKLVKVFNCGDVMCVMASNK
ncbi:MAG: methyltransferase domain-containing protein, partial [Spirochaetales bacterium]|nr:methyltransferase domain-containing protein [Spirochaetales bacterium]